MDEINSQQTTHLPLACTEITVKGKHKDKTKRNRKQRQFGSAKGMIHMTEDFTAPLDEFKNYM